MSALLPSDSALGGSPTETPPMIPERDAVLREREAYARGMRAASWQFQSNTVIQDHAERAYPLPVASSSQETPE